MQKDYTHISIVLDRSGSMDSIKSDTIGGFNAFLAEQKAAPGTATITLVQFDHEYQSVYAGIPLSDAQPLTGSTFVPRGCTALLDAIGRTINDLGSLLSQLPEDARPEKVVFVIVTDGQENASREFTLAQVNDLIKTQREIYSWEFVFLGANQNAIAAAMNMGISAASAMTYAADAAGTKDAFRSASKNLVSYRVGRSVAPKFTLEDRDKQRRTGSGWSGGFKN